MSAAAAQRPTSAPRASVHDHGAAFEVELVVESGGVERARHRLPPRGRLSIGRDAECTIALDDDAVSRCHAFLTLEPSALWVEDVSTNGTLVGSVTLRRRAQRVEYGTTIRMGTSTLYVLARFAETGAGTGTGVGHGHGHGHEYGSGIGTAFESESVSESVSDPASESDPVPVPVPVPVPGSDSDSDSDSDSGSASTPEASHEQRRQIHKLLLEHLDMNAIDAARVDDPALRPRVLAALRRIVGMLLPTLPVGIDRDRLVGQMADEALGLGPLEHLLADPTVSEIMVVDAHTIYVEQRGVLRLSGAHFTDDERVRAAIERIVTPLGRRVDESSPLCDARLADGSRVNVAIEPVAVRGSCITIRKFRSKPLTIEELCELGTMSPAMARFLTRCVKAKKNIVIAGGTGSGKTTLLNVLSGAIPAHERIVTIEDAAELTLGQPHVVSLESRPQNMEGKGEISVRDLLRNALRMRPDRIVVGECRGGEALDMLQAMNTGHDGSLTTTHANSPSEALARIETLALMSGVALPQRAIREQIGKSVHLLVQQSRLSDGSRRVTAISELAGLDPDGELRLRPLFEFTRTGIAEDGRVLGDFHATGYLPGFLPEMIVQGLIAKGGPYL